MVVPVHVDEGMEVASAGRHHLQTQAHSREEAVGTRTVREALRQRCMPWSLTTQSKPDIVRTPSQ